MEFVVSSSLQRLMVTFSQESRSSTFFRLMTSACSSKSSFKKSRRAALPSSSLFLRSDEKFVMVFTTTSLEFIVIVIGMWGLVAEMVKMRFGFVFESFCMSSSCSVKSDYCNLLGQGRRSKVHEEVFTVPGETVPEIWSVFFHANKDYHRPQAILNSFKNVPYATSVDIRLFPYRVWWQKALRIMLHIGQRMMSHLEICATNTCLILISVILVEWGTLRLIMLLIYISSI